MGFMYRDALTTLKKWWDSGPNLRKPLIIRGARQVGKSFLVRDFSERQRLRCLELNFEKEPSLRRLFVEGNNSKTIGFLEVHFGCPIDSNSLLFLDEIQAAPEVFARLRYFFEDSPQIGVIAAGSLLEFALEELEYSVPVGRLEYLHLGPMRFEEYLLGLGEKALVDLIRGWKPQQPKTLMPDVFHDRLLSHARDFSIVGGMPEAVARFVPKRDFLGCAIVQRSILETYRNDFAKFRRRIPLERLEKVFGAVPGQVGRKWVHSRVSPDEKAHTIETALDALCKARVAHRVFHASGNGIPLSAERKDNLYKVLFLDVGLMGIQLGLQITDLLDSRAFMRVNEGSI
ncbi:MAG: AAA family ATPase, partial [Bdellovibrionota bacterium]